MIVGTAGHIDHGKSTLVRALTGVDPDRLPEEKARGITIDLGFAYRKPKASDEPVLGFVDVPGHERFVHNMLAGACGIDLVLLVVAADDGPMPQTREHLQIIDLLGVERGLVALSKADLVPPGRLAEVTTALRQLLAPTTLAGAEIVPVSAVTGAGVEEIETHLLLAAAELPPRAAEQRFRLAVDRSFAVAGAGVVVTGTVHGGRFSPDDRLVLTPSGTEVRVRGLHAQNRAATEGHAGQRCAANLVAPQLHKDDIRRGEWLADPALHAPTERCDISLRLLRDETRPLTHWTPVHCHVAAEHVSARVALLEGEKLAPGATALAQLVLDRPIGALWGDRVVLRDQSARRTIGGGMVLDPWSPARGRRRPERLATLMALTKPDAEKAVAALGALPLGAIELPRFARARALTEANANALWTQAGLVRIGAYGLSPQRWEALSQLMLAGLAKHHGDSPESPGLDHGRLRLLLAERLPPPLFAAAIDALQAAKRIETDGARLRLPGHSVQLTPNDEKLWARIEPLMAKAKFEPPRVRDFAQGLGAKEEDVRTLLRRLAKMGRLVQVAPDHFFPRPVVAAMVAIVADMSLKGEVTAAAFRDRIGTGRKLAILVLEFFDRAGITARRGDLRRVQKDKLGLFGKAA
jgi:selenocysteine-specific elongation factor